ncbi:MAG: phosphatase PAP2 family protein [Abditibacteriaceae bacterium]
MQIFYLINGFAGQSSALDALMRFLYIATVPILATALAAWILLVPRSWMRINAPSRRTLLAASCLSVFFGALTIGAISAFEYFALGGAILSHRPFLTHFVTSLVMEPNNNSFPCFEVMFAASLATLLWAARPRVGICGWILAAALGIAHLYCGTNYTVDVVIGAIWGTAIAVLALSFCGIRLTLPLTRKKRIDGKFYFQGTTSILIMAFTLIYVTNWMANTPNHLPPLFALLHNSKSAIAAPMVTAKSTFTADTSSNDSDQKSREMLLLTDSVKQDGYLPHAEKYLLNVIQNQRTGMKILGVNVAEVKSGITPYRCAAIRFEVNGKGNAARKRVTAVATHLLKMAFHADVKINHIDILGIKSNLENSTLYTEGGTPVFTASVDRSSLILHGSRAWLNASTTNPGLWLRARSLLYFNPQILSSNEVFPVKEFLNK